MARNHQAHVLLLFALAKINAVMTPINPEFGVEETRYVLDHAQPRLVLVDDHSSDSFLKARDCMQSSQRPLAWCIDASPDSVNAPELPAFYPAVKSHQASLSPDSMRLQSEQLLSLQAQTQGEDTCLIIYTSGTTGFPKGVMHSQRSFLLGGEAFVERMYLQHDDRLMIVLPFFHMNALFYSVAGGLAAGASIAIMPRFSASSFWRQAVQSNSTIVNLIDAACQILKKRPRHEYLNEHRLRAAYGVRHTAWPTFQEEFHIPHLVSGYGMTEIPGVTCSPFMGLQKPGTMGPVGKHPDANREWAACRVVDEQGVELGAHQVGELWVKTPIIMQGYFRDPEQTQKQFDNGWFKTGDLVSFDEDGYYTFVSRKNDIIRRRGENISGAELDRVISTHPKVLDVAVIAVPAELGEDDIMAVVVAKPNEVLTAHEVAQWCREHLALTKVPRYVVFVQTIPYTPTHKVAKSVLRNDPSLLGMATDLG
jgi:crotonobetaine/carnitine-CoA ligase